MSKIIRNIRYTAITFTRSSKSTGILLILSTIVSLVLTNLSCGERYVQFWEKESYFLQKIFLPHTIEQIVNDGLMSLFFLLASMEIKRELINGELASMQKAMLPVIAAIGGVLIPALLYLVFNLHNEYTHGWGIPTATDIAFSIGILSLLGRRFVPNSLKVFLTALAIIDDLIAILIVAFFYGGQMHIVPIFIMLLLITILFYTYKKNKQTNVLHIILGILLWYTTLQSGIHGTIAGVVFGLLVPTSSMHLIEKKLHIPVNFVIVPLFALANTCIPLSVHWNVVMHSHLLWGIALGLFAGKALGICTFSYLAIKVKLAKLPNNIHWYRFVGAAILAGIGFTMSLFIVTLAFDELEVKNISKIAILIGSFCSMIVGYVWLRCSKRLS